MQHFIPVKTFACESDVARFIETDSQHIFKSINSKRRRQMDLRPSKSVQLNLFQRILLLRHESKPYFTSEAQISWRCARALLSRNVICFMFTLQGEVMFSLTDDHLVYDELVIKQKYSNSGYHRIILRTMQM